MLTGNERVPRVRLLDHGYTGIVRSGDQPKRRARQQLPNNAGMSQGIERDGRLHLVQAGEPDRAAEQMEMVGFFPPLVTWLRQQRRGVAEHSYGVLRSYKWDMLGDWSIDANNKITGGPMSVTFVAELPNDPLVKPRDASCEVCAPTGLDLIRRDGSI
jgi:hypothetical protein